jgi:hypothetical protein
MQSASASYVVFDSASSQNYIDIDGSNKLPGSSGPISYSFTSDGQIQLTSSSTDQRRGMCLKPSILVAGVQTFVAFKFPTLLTQGASAEIWLLSEDGQYQISSAVKFAANGAQSLSVSADSSDYTAINLASDVEYVLLLTASQTGDVLSTQVINLVCITFHIY